LIVGEFISYLRLSAVLILFQSKGNQDYLYLWFIFCQRRVDVAT